MLAGFVVAIILSLCQAEYVEQPFRAYSYFIAICALPTCFQLPER